MLTFDEIKHEYRWNGQVVPGVTSLLSPLSDYSFVNPQVLADAAQFGRDVHLACEFYDQGTLDESALHADLRPYLDAWVKFLHETGFVVQMCEQKVYHHQLGYAGTLDREGTLDEEAVIDIKTVTTLMPATGPQLFAYESALISQPNWGGPKKLKKFAVQLKEDGNYKLKEYEDKADWSAFVSLLNIHQWKRNHNIIY